MSKHIFWISSYPKSGNTLFRAIACSLFFSDNGIFDLPMLNHTSQFEMRRRLNIIKNINEEDFYKLDDLKILSKYWKVLQSKQNLKIEKGFGFVKSHSCLVSMFDNWFTTEDNTAGFVYIVRDPRDVAVSMSHHSNMNNESVVEYLITNQHEIAHIDKNSKKEKQDSFKKSIMGTWSMNYLSWKSYKGRKIHFVRYEDLINDTKNEFLKILEYLKNIVNFNIDEQKLNKAIIETSFENLSNMELKNGFIEQSWEKNFFRKGKIGDWKESLDNKLSKKIEDTFYKEMEYLGYI